MKRINLIFCFLLLMGVGCDKITALYDQLSPSTKTTVGTKKVKIKASDSKISKQTEPLSDDVVARVGDWTITIDEFNDRLKALKEVMPDFDIEDTKNKKDVLQELIRQQLLVEAAEKEGIADRKQIKQAVEEFRRTLLVREMVKKLIEDIDVSDSEALDFYNKNKDKIIEPVSFHVRLIKVKSKLKANELYVNLLKGANFAQLAQENSIGKNASKGGDLGFVKEMKDLPFPEMAKPLLSLEEGEISDVFECPDGYCIIKLEEKKGGNPKPFEDVKDLIKENQKILKQQKAVDDYIKELEKQTKVEINESLLE